MGNAKKNFFITLGVPKFDLEVYNVSAKRYLGKNDLIGKGIELETFKTESELLRTQP
jgi:hypothetical protein